jgi:hypothetical protein
MRAVFEKWLLGRDPILGIDLRDDRIVFADVNLRGGNRWKTIRNEPSQPSGRELVKDRSLFMDMLGDVIAGGASRIERCALCIPEELSYISWVTLPKELSEKSEQVRYEAALERIYLRPQDVRGQAYYLTESLTGETRVLVVAIKEADVVPVEDCIRSANVEISCITPRVFALHHLSIISGVVTLDEAVAYHAISRVCPQFHLFTRGRYQASAREWSELVPLLCQERDGENRPEPDSKLSIVVDGSPTTTAFVMQGEISERIINLSKVRLGGSLVLDPDEVAAAALSLWEA